MNVSKFIFLGLIFICLKTQAQVDTLTQSSIRKNYLEKQEIFNRQLNDIAIKWTWIESNPVEDSIAVSEGWYAFMAKRKTEIEGQILDNKLNQLINYYTKLKSIENSELKNLVNDFFTRRNSLAPSYPFDVKLIPLNEIESSLIASWILNKQSEYEALTQDLEFTLLQLAN